MKRLILQLSKEFSTRKKICLDYSNNWTLKYLLWEVRLCPYAINILYVTDKTRDCSHMGALEKKQWIKT